MTAAHVLRERTLLRIVYGDGREIKPEQCDPPLYGPDDLDLAIIRCDPPAGLDPIPVEWRRRATAPLAELITFGYPRIARAHPGLHHATGQLHQVATRYSQRDSLIISSSQPGCSGGPVVDSRGYVIGVIEQENISEEEGGRLLRSFALPHRTIWLT